MADGARNIYAALAPHGKRHNRIQTVEMGMSAGLEFEDMNNKRWLRTGMFCSRGARVAQDGMVCLQLCQRLFWSKLQLGLDLQISWEALRKAHAMIHRAGPYVHCTVGKPWPKPSLLLWQEIGNLCLQLLALLLSLVSHLSMSKSLCVDFFSTSVHWLKVVFIFVSSWLWIMQLHVSSKEAPKERMAKWKMIKISSWLLQGNLTMYISSFWFPSISGDLLLSQNAAFTNAALIHG